uniref:Uncharacterized protein n=1 Tax=Rhizophora mucronata TaxID=61149 RepID=A0A2P2JZA3_RHIMU
MQSLWKCDVPGVIHSIFGKYHCRVSITFFYIYQSLVHAPWYIVKPIRICFWTNW